MENVVASIQNEKIRQIWDTNIDQTEELDHCYSKRLQVVHTTFKSTAGLGRRDFVEKKIHFAVKGEKIKEKEKVKGGRSVTPDTDVRNTSTPDVFYTYFSTCPNAPERLKTNKRGFHNSSANYSPLLNPRRSSQEDQENLLINRNS